MNASLTPERILHTSLGFWASKTLLSAIEIGLFTELAAGPLDADEIGARLDLHPRARRDFLDALVALQFLERTNGTYGNTPETAFFLDRNKPTYAGGMLEMANARLYPFWADLTEGLRSGEPQNEVKRGKQPLFETLYADPRRLEQFMAAMTGLSHAANLRIAQSLPWKNWKSFVDVGCAQGDLAVQLALAHPHLEGIGIDLPPVAPIFERYIDQAGVAERVRFAVGDFFRDALPTADVVLMGHILHDWNLAKKRLLIRKAFDALPSGGALVVFESLIDDDRIKNSFGLLMSLNMLIETPGGFDYTGEECAGWMRQAGFKTTDLQHLAGPTSMVVGTK